MTLSRNLPFMKLACVGLAAAACLLSGCHRASTSSAAIATGPRASPQEQPVRAEKSAPPPPASPATAQATPPVSITTDIIVGRNDTLDRIFRKLKLNLTDLANLRALP